MNENSIASIKVFCGSSHPTLGSLICQELCIEQGKMNIIRFADGEIQPSIEENVRGRDVFVIQSTHSPAENWIELFLIIDALKRASAKTINALIPYFGYARQDRKDKPRVPIASRVFADILQTLGVSRIITMDLHAPQIQGFFSIPVDHIYASAVFLPYIQELNLDNIVIVAPDAGASKMANAYAKFLRVEMALCYKYRSTPNEVDTITVIGNIKGKNAIIVDDIVDTAGTLLKVAKILIEGGVKSIIAVATHPVLSRDAIEKIENSPIDKLIVSNTIPLKRPSPKIIQLSVAPLFAEVIRRLVQRRSISEVFIM